MQDLGVSSVDRYMWERGVSMTGYVYGGRGGVIALSINGSIQTALGAVFTGVGILAEPIPFLYLGPIFGTVGLGLLAGAYFWQKKLGRQILPQAKLSQDGMRLVMRILNHIGW